MTSLGAPWVAQRVWPMPVVDGRQRRLRRGPSRGWRACPAACPRRCAPSIDERDAGRVVAAVLQPPQPLDHDALRLLCHRRSPRFRTWAGVYRCARPPPSPAVGPRPARRTGPRGVPPAAATMRAMSSSAGRETGSESSPYVELDRAAWAALASVDRAAADRRGDRPAPRSRRRARPRRGRAGLPPAVPPAQHVRRVRRPAAPAPGGVPATAPSRRAPRS